VDVEGPSLATIDREGRCQTRRRGDYRLKDKHQDRDVVEDEDHALGAHFR
jgi:hypothetical protein